MRRFLWLAPLFFLLLVAPNGKKWAVEAQSARTPELPREFLDTGYVSFSGRTINVRAGSNLQTALDSVNPGDMLVLESGATFVGNFVLRNKTGSGWIWIRSSTGDDLLPLNKRVNPSQANLFPKIITPNSGPALVTEPGAHNYRLIGLEFGIALNAAINYGIVVLGDGGRSQNALELVPRDLIIDRCYVHGNATGDVSRGIALNSARTAVIDSWVSDCHGIGLDTQALCGWNGPGPFKVVNNYLEGAGENVLFGGADPAISGLVPSDIEFRRNECRKPLHWFARDSSYAGINWTVKNLFELKNAQRVLVEGNLFEYNWVDAQNGYAILFTVRNQDGSAPWSVVQDVTFINNIVRHTPSAINILGRDYNYPSQQVRRITVANNLFDDVDGSRWGGGHGAWLLITSSPADITLDHNTVFQSGHIVLADGDPNYGVVITNNITQHGYGVFGSGLGEGNRALATYFPDAVFTRNVIVNGSSSLYSSYPGNFFPTSNDDVGWMDWRQGNYRLGAASLYRSAGTDGRDLGADIDAIGAAFAGGAPASNQPPRVSVSATTAAGTAPLTVLFSSEASDADGEVVSRRWSFGDGGVASEASPSHTYITAGNFVAQLTVTDNLGASATASLTITVTAPAGGSRSEVVLYAAEAAQRQGAWMVQPDPEAAGHLVMRHPDLGEPKLSEPRSSPTNYFELSFEAEVATAYRLWVRGRADNSSPYNDSVHVQFSDSVDAMGSPIFRTGTTSATVVNLEDCLGCGLNGWGWQDNGWGTGAMGPVIYFASSGLHSVRVQTREDGLSIDQIVLSPEKHLNASPGALRGDTTILPASSPSTMVLYASRAAVIRGNWTVVSDATAAGGSRIFQPDSGSMKIAKPAAKPRHYFELTFSAAAGVAYRLWVRGIAQADLPYNDSIFVQFSDSVDAKGEAVFRIGSSSGTAVNLEDCLGCGLRRWAWQDNGWGAGQLGPVVYFAASGQHTLRIQTREDGISLDQIVLSPGAFLNSAPGMLKDDRTILFPSTP